MPIEAVIFAISLAVGTIGSIAGFGIGTLLTPVIALLFYPEIAIAAVSIPHLIGNGVRCWTMRKRVNMEVLRKFGAWSALGAVLGALLLSYLPRRELAIILGLFLIIVAVSHLVGHAERLKFSGVAQSAAGLVSGFFGGLVGSQGGIRAGAMLGLGMHKAAFVATNTAIGVVVDSTRMPVYLLKQGDELMNIERIIVFMSAGVLVGTFIGSHMLHKVKEDPFRKAIALLVMSLGAWIIVKNVAG